MNYDFFSSDFLSLCSVKRGSPWYTKCQLVVYGLCTGTLLWGCTCNGIYFQYPGQYYKIETFSSFSNTEMGPLGSSQRSTLTILLCLLVHTVCSVNAELAFLGQEPNRAIVSQGLQTGEAVYQLFVVDMLSNEETLGITFSSSLTSSYPFFLVPGSGQILVTGALSEEEYVFVVQATSSGGITIETNITIVVVPLSDSDTTPRFEHSLYEIEIPENLPVMSAFNAIRAFSLILTDTIQRYSIVAGNTDTDFVINNNNGLLRVNRNLDRERTNFYQLTVRYVDDYSSVDTIVRVSIGDINDETPRFSRSLYNVTIAETLPIGSIALTVNATDDDIGANAMVTYSFDFTASSAFSLDPIEGVLRTTEALDYERQPKYQFSITVQDGGSPQLTSVTTVLVNLINIDDECPRFENPIFIEELAYDVTDTPPGVGTEILTVMATDPDRFSSVTYSIVSGHTDVLALDVETGVITLASTDNDPRGQYTLNVSASDNSCTDQSFVRVDIGIGNVNVHSPQFQTDCTANLMENPPLGTEVITLLATDGDIGFNGLVTYSLLSGTNLFEIDTSGVVRTIASPETYDRELQSTLQAGVTASDGGGRQDYCLLTVTLDDENDNTPRIPLSMYSTSLARDSGIGTFVLQISADDPDVGDNGRIEYSIDSSSSSLPFQINSMNGVITTSVTLPSTTRHEFTVFAADMGTAVQLTSSTMVTITLTDGDALPRFTALNYTGTTCENPAIGTTVLTVNASSTLLNGFIQFTILAGSDYRSNSRQTFNIRPVSGASGVANIIIGSQTLIDFEQLSPHLSFQFFVRATNAAGSSIVPVEIFVIDIDDNSPEFLTPSLSVTIVENEVIGTTVAQVQAMDPDSGTNGEVLYRFMSGEISPYFDIATNGLITSKIVFDFESAMDTRGNLLIEAYNPNPVDNGSMCGSFTRFSATIFIEWNILDQNDNPPSFEESLLTVQIQEDAQIQSKILRLNATDMDISDFGVLSFSINSGNDGTFGIESDYIVLTRRLDFETTAEYELVIHVTDGIHSIQDCPQSQCVAIVRILVTDIDDEPPVFSSLEYRASVVENAPTGTSILEILATDIDSPSIEYKLTGLAEGRFTVSQTGVVSVAGPIDREQFPGGSLVFLAFADGGSLATADIVIDIQDVNDYEPRFSGVFSGLVEENSDPGEEGLVVSQVRAVDLDQGENGTVHYSIIFGGENGFRIDKETGVITAHAQYDREATPSFVLVVQATDNGTSIQLSSQTQVVIEIGDVNDNRPRFPFSYMFARVFENSPIGHSVFFLPTIDADSALNSRAIFSLLATNPMETKFSLNLITGEVTIAGSLDYEIPLHRLYTLTVSVVDPDSPSESDVGTLQIVLLDRNDNPPQISVTKSETGLLQETFPIGIQVAMVTASDLDIGQNSELMFEISDGNTNGDFELLVEDGGAIIKSANQFDYETTLSYMLTVTVSDMGSPPLSVSETIDFNIIDVNDEPPIFTQSEYSISILENSAPSVNLIQVQASDRDTGNGGEIDRYELISGNEGGWFALNSSGVLSSLTVFDREERAEYVLTVAAYDRGVVPIQGTARIVVTITDVNDNPSFDGGHLTVLINALNGMVTPGNIAPFHFNDPDSDDSFSGCTVIRQDQTGVFTVDSSCVIHLLVNNPVEGDYNYIEVRGRDGTHTDVTVSAIIRVQHFNFARLIAENLITLTLNASVEAYIVDRLNISFPMELARALQVAESNIQIITVQQGTIQPESTVDVTFVARDSNGAYITPAAMLHQLFVQRDNLVLNGHGILSLPLDACAAEPCQNQAGCRTIQNVVRTDRVINTQEFVYFAPRIDFSYECVCAPGTTGQNCETNVNDCYSNPCQQGGVCTDTVGGFSCVCPSGYTGDDCSIAPDTCSTNACQNGGTCSIITDDISCNCNPGYYGPLCQYNYFIPSSFCSQDNPCSNGGECSAGRDGYSCVCSPGFSGEVCEIETQIQGGCVGNPCYNGSTCEETLLGPNCICSVGFTGPNCRWPLNSCELEPCLNGGTCTTGLYDTHVCSCAPGYSGDDCSLIIAPCFNEPCLNSGRCMDMDDGSYMCECMSGYYGDDCEISVQPLDFCAMVDCLDNGNCTSGRDTFTCSCDDRYIGVDCAISTLSDDVSCAGNPCQHGSVCMNDASSADGLRCFCSPGFTGSRCETNINDCLNSPCMNEGTCTDGINGYTCTCPSGLAGYDCEVRCPEGLSGTICQVPILQCLDNPCQNNGTCIQTGTKFNCNCPVTHTGSRCESELLCTESTCLNGGRCIATQTGGIMCECGVGFSGENCELLTVSFSGSQTQSSYRAFASLEIRGHGRIEFEFATVDRNGLLLYNTQLQNGRTEDFVAVEIVGGALQVSVSHGSGDSSVRFVSSPRGVADGDWHQVVIETNQKVST